MLTKFIIKYFCNINSTYFWKELTNEKATKNTVKELINKGIKTDDIKIFKVEKLSLEINLS